jgi:stress response protein YsnF
MTRTFTTQDFERVRGAPVYGSEGERIGSVDKLFVDNDTGQPEWIGVGTGFLRTKSALVPVEGCTIEADGVRVPYDADRVKSSPDIDDDQISQQTESELYSYYGLKYTERRSESGLPEGRTGRSTGKTKRSTGKTKKDEQSVTRHEEELKVGKRPTEVGRFRLHKWVTTEPVEADVELRQETAEVRRERIDQPVSGVEMGEREVDVTLRGEEPVVEKQTVAKERVSVEKGQDTRKERVTDEVRKEHVEAEGEDIETEQRR